jgi:hypothetical protein
MAEHIVALLFTLTFLNGKLHFALNLSHEKVVDHDVVGGVIELILDPYQLKDPIHLMTTIQHIHSFD